MSPAHDDEPRALAALRAHQGFIARVAASYERDPGLREDLMQDISLALWRAWPSFREEASPLTFIARIAHCRGVDHVARAMRTRGGSVELDDALADPAPDPYSRAEHAAVGRWLQGAIRRLPLGCRQPLVLALEGMSHREIGQALGLEENAVAQRISRARRQLREWRESGS